MVNTHSSSLHAGISSKEEIMAKWNVCSLTFIHSPHFPHTKRKNKQKRELLLKEMTEGIKVGSDHH